MIAKMFNPKVMLAIEITNYLRRTDMFQKLFKKAAVNAATSPVGKAVIKKKVGSFIDNLTKEDGDKLIQAVKDNKSLIMHFVEKM